MLINNFREENIISVWNNGQGIPVVEHKDEKMYVPTMIFGHLLTSSNYNDEEAKVTGGRNGYGAKLCNIFSNKFTVETASREYRKVFKQVIYSLFIFQYYIIYSRLIIYRQSFRLGQIIWPNRLIRV